MATAFNDNVRVNRTRWGHEYLSIRFKEMTEESPWEVMLQRYCVPGRCDTYCFDYSPGGSGVGDRVRYFAEGMNLPQGVKLLTEDLERPLVVKMLSDICLRPKLRYFSRRLVEQMLPAIGPKSKALRSCRKTYEAMLESLKTEVVSRDSY